MASYGAEVVGLDLGNSVDYARRRNSGNPRVHIVQGSIFQPPFKHDTFDFITSIGVLHHLPDPRRGFETLVPLLQAGGTIHIWVYGLETMSFVYRVSHLTPLRGLTSRLPPAASYVLSAPIVLALEVGVFLPVRLAGLLGAGTAAIPPQLSEVATLPFSAKVAEVHDRIGAPVTHFLSEDELRDWYARAGLRNVAVIQTPGGRGWTASGEAGQQAEPVPSLTVARM
jgi:SAM-dependent methyltransferase